MIREDGDRVLVEGVMNLSTATRLLDEGNLAIQKNKQGGRCRFDLSAVTEVDSSGLAVVFGWLRTAKSLGISLDLQNSPQGLLSMADVYGVGDLLPVA